MRTLLPGAFVLFSPYISLFAPYLSQFCDASACSFAPFFPQGAKISSTFLVDAKDVFSWLMLCVHGLHAFMLVCVIGQVAGGRSAMRGVG